MKIHALLFLIVFTIPTANAQKLYKIVDENGTVTFSQYPPEEQASSNIENVTVKNASNAATVVSNDGSYEYCGEIRLPKHSLNDSTSRYFLKNVAKKRTYWKERLETLTRRIEQEGQRRIDANTKNYNSGYNSSSYASQSYQKSSQRMRDLRCAINWSENKRDKIAEMQLQNKQEKQRLLVIYQQVEAKLLRACGELPEFNPADKYNEYQRKSWYNCGKTHLRNLKKIQKKMDRI